MNTTEEEGEQRAFMGKKRKEHHCRPSPSDQNRTRQLHNLSNTRIMPPLLRSYMLAPKLMSAPIRQMQYKGSTSPWSGQDSQIDNPIALQG